MKLNKTLLYDTSNWTVFRLCVLLAIDFSHLQLLAIYSVDF